MFLLLISLILNKINIIKYIIEHDEHEFTMFWGKKKRNL